MIYEPREDSLFLAEYVKKYAKGSVLDMGTGSGIQVGTAQKKARKVTGADINPDAIAYCKKKYKKIKFVQSDLFSNIKGKFDVIIFNPPYLPDDARLKDLTVDGGKYGYEVTERFLNQANDFLKPKGCILLVFSSFTNIRKIHDFLENNMLVFSVLGEKKLFYETLFVYRIEKNKMLKRLENKRVSNIHYLSKGHRGIIFTGSLNRNKIVIKCKKSESKAEGRIRNEALSLKLINKHKLGPKLLFYTDKYLVYKYVTGDFILDYFEQAKKKDILKVIKEVFEQCFILDKLGYDKMEMHHPVKHIIVGKKVIMIDFERMHKTLKPKNVTQFCQFIGSGKVMHLLKTKKFRFERSKLYTLAHVYKSEQTKKNLEKIISIIN